MGRLAGGLARLGCAVAAIALCGAGVGCFEPGIVPERWVPSHWDDPLDPLRGQSLSVWIVVPHGNSYAKDKTAQRTLPPKPAPMSPSLMKEQTVGSFGVSSTDLPEAMRAANGSKPPDPPPLVLQHDPRFDALENRMQRVRMKFKDETLRPITISIGLAMYPNPARDTADLLRMSDHALYEAKHQGRDRINVAGDGSLAVTA